MDSPTKLSTTPSFNPLSKVMKVKANCLTFRTLAGLALFVGVLGAFWHGFYCTGHLFLGITELMVDEGSASMAQEMLSGAGLHALRSLPCLSIVCLSGWTFRT